MVARANKNTLHRSSVALDKWSPASACDVQLPLHFTLTTFLLVHKYCSLHGGLCARYSHWPSACLWLLPFLLSSSSPHCRWLVTNGAVNYSGWAGIKYEGGCLRGKVEKQHTHISTHRWLSFRMPDNSTFFYCSSLPATCRLCYQSFQFPVFTFMFADAHYGVNMQLSLVAKKDFCFVHLLR